MAVEKNLPTLVDGVQVYNDGNPIPPGTQASITCCLCCHSPDIAYSGIPEGTTRVPEAEEKEILQRWYGHWKLHNLGPVGPGSGASLAFTEGYIDGNILALSGGMHNRTQHVGSYNDSSHDSYVTTSPPVWILPSRSAFLSIHALNIEHLLNALPYAD